MTTNFSLTIPKPCQEDWHEFKPTEKGGFCNACQKEVIDFTRWTDQAIIQHFEKANTKTCGKFQVSQLKRFQPNSNNQSRLPIAALLALSVLGISKPAESKAPKQNFIIEQLKTFNSNQIKADTLIEKIIITGTMFDEQGGTIPGVNILQKGIENGTVSDADGKFMLVIKRPKYMETLVFTFIGMVTVEQEIMAMKSEKSIEVTMYADKSSLEEVEIIAGGVCVPRRFSPRGIWWKIRGVFSKNY